MEGTMCHALKGAGSNARLCPLRHWCERYIGEPTGSAYFSSAPFDEKARSCVEMVKGKEWERHVSDTKRKERVNTWRSLRKERNQHQLRKLQKDALEGDG